jgi:hypothetical protein
MKQNGTSDGNRTDFDELWQLFRKPFNTPTVVVACVSVILNIIVITTFMKIRKTKGKLTQGYLQARISWVSGLLCF